MTSPRRDFLRHAGLTAAAAAALPGLANAAPAPAPSGDMVSRQLALLAEIDAAEEQERQQQGPQQPTWDISWTAKVTGKHKAMFDVPEIEGGAGVFRAAIWGRQYTDVLKLQPADLSTVVVIRHAAIPLLMNNDFWLTYEVGKQNKIKGEDGKTQKFNPVLAEPDAKGPGSPYTLDKLMAAGAIVLGCNLAFRSIVAAVEKKDKLKGAEARTKALSYVLPGAIMQPSGIFANVMAGEAGCQFVRAV
jgi:hypothetical protein